MKQTLAAINTHAAKEKSQQLLQAIFNNASVSIFILDENQQCIYMNPAAEKLTGFSFAEVEEKSLHAVLHHSYPDGTPFPKDKCPINNAFPLQGRAEGEEIFVHKDGHFYHVSYTASPIKEESIKGTVMEVINITEQKRTLTALIEQEERFRSIAKATSDAVWDWDMRTDKVWWSEGIQKVFGYEMPQVGDNAGWWYEHIHPDDRKRVIEDIHNSIDLAIPYWEHEYLYRCADGTYKDVLDRGYTIQNAAGKTVRMVGGMHDITERKRIQRALQEERETLETLNRLGSSLSSTLDLQSLVQLATDEATKLTGAEFGAFFYNVYNAEGKSYMLYTLSGVPREAFSQFPMPRNTAIFAPTFGGEGTVRLDDVTKDPRYGKNKPNHGMPKGHLPVCSYLAVPVVSRSGEVLGGLFFGHSNPGVFTQRAEHIVEGIAAQAAIGIDNARLYEQLVMSEEKFRTLADSIPQFAWMTDETGSIFWYNRRWYEYTGTTLEEMTGWGWQKVHHPDHVDGVTAKFKRAIERKESWEDIFPLLSKDGEYNWFLSRAFPVYYPDGKLKGWFGTNTDITAQLKAEQDLKEALDKAEAASRAKSEFLANMSHEIRTPMNAVVGLANLLEMTRDNPARQLEFIRTLKLSAQQLMDLINDLLDIAKLESHQVQLEQIPFALKEIVAEVVSVNAVSAKEKTIELGTEQNCPLDTQLVGDPLRLRQILMNLVNNAIKFTERGSVKISTHCHDANDGRMNFQIEVTDTGIGIAEDKQDTIFSKFTQADSSITRKYGGTGLGLSISKSLVELMGGTLTVKSQLGKGTTFAVDLTLPLAETAPVVTPLYERSLKQHESEQDERNRHFRILLVEDYKANIIVATSLLQSFGYSYELAETGQEALDKLAENHFDLILMDVQMPVMDGYKATRLIREREKKSGGKHIPIIGMTAHALAGDREKCLRAGMDEYISKPFQPDDLKDLLTQYCNARKPD